MSLTVASYTVYGIPATVSHDVIVKAEARHFTNLRQCLSIEEGAEIAGTAET